MSDPGLKVADNKIRLLSSKQEIEAFRENKIDYSMLQSPAISSGVAANRVRGKSRDVRSRPIKSVKRNHQKPPLKGRSQNVRIPNNMPTE